MSTAALAALADVERLELPSVDRGVASAIRVTADRAAALLHGGAARPALLAGAMDAPDAVDAAAHALAAALRGIATEDASDHVAMFVGVAAGLVSSVPQEAVDANGTGVRRLLARSEARPTRQSRLTELFVAGTLVRTTARRVPLEEGLDAVAAVERACEEVDTLDVDHLLDHVYGTGRAATGVETARASLVGGALALNAVQRITGGVLNGDAGLQHKGWTRAAALVAELARLAGHDLHAADVRAAAARMAADEGLLGRPDAAIGDVLTTALGLQAAVALGGLDDAGPAQHLLARLVAHAARC
ncbi:hypothetical protein [Conexibacter sp. SYSU D00693]|uniref:hypothetical protein n=1 Tax=Conexibacter sp. SYSU D00693 TaxID=2812560 RepID=UPI00196A330C|nr:hypothetical protein [Conexibacter sp. SYSU D00693]